MSRQISSWRKTAFYLGTGLLVLGVLLFLSLFLSVALDFEGSNSPAQTKSEFQRAFGGLVLAALGSFLRMLGARGMAGSGMVLDPKRAREDLEPYSRMAGGLVRDVLEEAEVLPKGDANGDAKPGARIEDMAKTKTVVMIRCQHCGKLNEEDSKFCQECGERL